MDSIKEKKILILSDACFNDNIFPLYKTLLDKGYDVTCLIKLAFTKVMLFNIEKRLPYQKIIKATEYPELKFYEKYMNMDKVFLVNHEIDKKHFWRDLTSTIAIFKFIIKGKFDIIHTDFAFWRSNILLYYFKNKIVNITHDTFPHTGTRNTIGRRFVMWLKYKLIKRFVILNRNDYEKFCSYHKLDKSNVFINSLGPLDCVKMFKNDNIKEDPNTILFFGRIAPYKGVEYLCEAMLEVNSAIPDCKLVIAGGGEFYFDIDKYKKLPYINIINRFLEEDELASLIQECAISICAYTDATQSGGVLTSFAFNKPVIVSNVETLLEVVKDKYNGVVVPKKDSHALAQAIINLLHDEDLRKTISDNIAYEYNHGNNSWNRIADKYVEIYRLIVN